MTKELDKLITVVNQQKGEIICLQAMVISLLRATPFEQRSEVLKEFDIETEVAKSTLLYSLAPDEVLHNFEKSVDLLNGIRVFPPKRDKN